MGKYEWVSNPVINSLQLNVENYVAFVDLDQKDNIWSGMVLQLEDRNKMKYNELYIGASKVREDLQREMEKEIEKYLKDG